MEWMVSVSTPKPLSPARASPEILSRIRLNASISEQYIAGYGRSLTPQGHHGIHFERTPSRQQRSQPSRDTQHKKCAKIAERIKIAHAIEFTAQYQRHARSQ